VKKTIMIAKILLFVVFYIFWVMGALAVIFGLFTNPEHPGDIPFIAIILYLVVIMIPVVLFNRWSIKPRWVDKVQANGKQATATILSVTDTALRINYRRIVKIKLRVEPRDEEPFEVTLENTWFARPIEGGAVQVKYDPNHKQHVVIVSDAQPLPGGHRHETSAHAVSASISDELAELARLHKNGDLSDDEFERAKKKLLR
jgi:hypothetical protein